MSNQCFIEVMRKENSRLSSDTVMVLFQDDYASAFRSYPKEEFDGLFPTVTVLLEHVSNWLEADGTFDVTEDGEVILDGVSSLIVTGLSGKDITDFTKHREGE